MIFEFIKENRSRYEVAEMCETLEVSTSGFYRWEKSEPSARKLEDGSLKERILEIHAQAVGDYGHRPIYEHLAEEGYPCGRDRTLRLMNELEISGKQSKAYKPQGTDSDRGSTYASYAFQNHLFALGMKSSMSAKGNCYDNGAMESFYGRFKTGSVRERIFSDETELRRHVFVYIEVFYNRFRKHSSLGYKNPIQFEREFFAPHGGQREERYLYQSQTN